MTSEMPFVGRAGELETVCQAMPRGADVPGRVIALTGEAGIGKTRLMSEVAALAGASGNRVLWSQAMESPATQPYFSWLLVLRTCIQQSDDETLKRDIGSGGADVANIVPELRDRLDIEHEHETLTDPAARFRIFDSVTRYLLAVASQKPLVILLDNLHVADRSSFALLEYFCQQTVGTPILVVLAYRDSELGRQHPLRQTLNTLSRNAGYLRLPLTGLSETEVATMLRSQIGFTPPSPFIEAVLNKSDGNPLFVKEVGRMLVGRGPDEQLTGIGFPFRVPESLREVIVTRLEALPDETARLLSVAAVLGREFGLSALAELANVRIDVVSRALHPAESAGVISTRRSGSFIFTHALFREVLYAEHSTVARVKLHRSAGAQLEARIPRNSNAHLSELAYHFFEAAQAGGTDKAVRYCEQAAAAATAQRAYGEAVVLLDRSLQAAELETNWNEEQRFRILRDLAQAQYQAGQLNAATQTLLKAAIIAHREGWWEELAGALFLFQLVCQQSGYRHIASVPLHIAVLENLPDNDIGLRARVYASLAKAYRTAGDPVLARESFRKSLKLARACGDQRVLLDCLRKGNWTIGREPDGVREGLEIARESLSIAETCGHKEAILDSLVDVTFQLCDLGRIDEIKQHLAMIREVAAKQRQPHFSNVLVGFETAVAILEGRWQDALDGARQGINTLPMQDVFGLRGRFGFQIFAIKKAQGTLTQVRDVAERIIASRGTSNLWLPGQILLQCEVGQRQQARAALRRLGDPKKIPRDDLFEISLAYLAEASAELRDKEFCSGLYELLLPYRGLNVTLPGTLMLGAASGYLGKLAVVLQQVDEARVLFEEAIESNEAMGAAPALACAQIDYARLLATTGSESDARTGRQLLANAYPIVEKLGLQPLLDNFNELAISANAGALTRREIDVLRLVAAGHRNRDISEHLNISHSTVATHVRNIFRKAGVSNRTEAGAFARRSGFVEE
jgi:DNA-binding CsgD family transcriptional regulator